MKEFKDKKYSSLLVWLCVAVYFVSYLTRINYGAVLVEIIASKGITMSAASLALTGSAITYGMGQLISGYLGDRMMPQKLVIIGLFTTAIMNFALPFCSYQCMIPLWCINGFAQAMMWPPIVTIMSSLLSEDEYKRGSVKVSWGSSFGTIAVYLFAPLIIKTVGWEYVFYFSGSLAIVMALTVAIAYTPITSHAVPVFNECRTEQTEPTETKHSAIPIFLMFICIAPSIIFQGILRDGITAWMPSYISDTYNLGSAVSILTGVVLPIFSILSFQVSSYINRKLIKNEMYCAGAIFAVGFISSLLLTLIGNIHPLFSVLLSALITASMHGVNVILICMTPPFFGKYGKVSLLSGMLNSCTYIGAAISTYGMAFISERFGWNTTIASWTLVAFLGTIACCIPANLWKKFKKQ